MPGPATKLGSLTAHGGSVIGPGCPTVLINNVPAIRVGSDMHLCPMVTPGAPPIPHVGMNCIGPGVLTVLIGKMPASTVGDNFLCVGPPAPVLTGAFDVLIGTGGGGGGSGGGGGGLSTIQSLKAGKAKPVKGTEVLPIDVQAAILDAQPYISEQACQEMIKNITDAITGAKDSAQEEKIVEFTIADCVTILEAVEGEDGYEAARFFASHLDYRALSEMAIDFITGSNPNPGNDPNLMPTRFMILYGADDSKLQQIDDHPDCFDNEEHKINVTNLRKGLMELGYKIDETGAYDNSLYIAHIKHMSTAYRVDYNALTEITNDEEHKYTVKENETLGVIARKFAIVSWKYLYDKNKDVISKNPDLLKEGTRLIIPQWDSTSGDEKIEAKGAKACSYTGGMRYAYPWVPLSLTLTDENANEINDFDEERELVIRSRQTGRIILSTTIKEHDIFESLLPGGIEHIQVGLKGFPLLIDGNVHYHPDDDPENQK